MQRSLVYGARVVLKVQAMLALLRPQVQELNAHELQVMPEDASAWV
jgi:hypothetical protein